MEAINQQLSALPIGTLSLCSIQNPRCQRANRRRLLVFCVRDGARHKSCYRGLSPKYNVVRSMESDGVTGLRESDVDLG